MQIFKLLQHHFCNLRPFQRDDMKIKPTSVSRPIKLSEVSEYFGFSTSKLCFTLDMLAQKQKIFSHDIKRTPTGDYNLSHYATTVLIVSCSMSKDTLLKLDRFWKTRTEQPGEYLSRLYIEAQRFAVSVERARIKQEVEQANKNRAALDYIMDFSPCPSDMAN